MMIDTEAVMAKGFKFSSHNQKVKKKKKRTVNVCLSKRGSNFFMACSHKIIFKLKKCHD